MNEVLNKAKALFYIHSKLALENYDVAAHELKVKNKDLKAKINQLKITRFKTSKVRIAMLKKELFYTEETQHCLKDMKIAFEKAFGELEQNKNKEVEKEINLIMDQCWD